MKKWLILFNCKAVSLEGWMLSGFALVISKKLSHFGGEDNSMKLKNQQKNSFSGEKLDEKFSEEKNYIKLKVSSVNLLFCFN